MAKSKNNASVDGKSTEVLIKFIKSPTTAYGLAYSEGDEVEVEIKQAADLIENGFAVAVEK